MKNINELIYTPMMRSVPQCSEYVGIKDPCMQITPHLSTTAKYNFVDTQRLLDVIESSTNFTESSHAVTSSRKFRGFQKHFYMLNDNDSGSIIGDSLPTIFVRNGHKADSVVIALGFYRLCCENQLPMTMEGFYFKIKHSKNAWNRITKVLPMLQSKIEELRSIQIKLSNIAATLGMADRLIEVAVAERPSLATIDFDDFITASRNEDKGGTLWSVMNIIQEKAVKGMELVRGDRPRAIRKLTSGQKNFDISALLLAEALKLAT